VRVLLLEGGRVWAGTRDCGVDLLDPATGAVRHFRHREADPASLPADAVFALYQAPDGGLWAGTDAGLARYAPKAGTFQALPQFQGEQVRAIYQDAHGVLWVGTVTHGLMRLDPGAAGPVSYRHDSRRADSLSNDHVWSLIEDQGGRLWVGTADGLNLMDRASGRFVRYRRDADQPQSLRDNEVMALYQDHGGSLWVGTRNGGASHWNPRSWLLGHYRSPALSGVGISAFAEDGSGRLAVGTIGRGVFTLRSGAAPVPLSVAPALPDARVMALLNDRGGDLWIGTMSAGLYRVDPEGHVRASWRHGGPGDRSLPADGIMALYQDAGGDVWVGTFGGGLARIGPTGAVQRYPVGPGPDALSGPRASALAADRDGNLWVGTIGTGLNFIEQPGGRVHHYRRDDRDPGSLSDDTVYAIHVSRTGEVWVGTAGGGLQRVVRPAVPGQEARFASPLAGHPGLGRVIYGIEEDESGNLWLSTDAGLVRFDPRDGSTVALHEAQGLQGEDFNFNAHFRGADGTLFFGGNDGFNAFQPAGVATAPPVGAPVLTAVSRMGAALTPGEFPREGRPLRLAYDDRLVTFEFAELDYTAPEANHYAYRLEGFDPQWIEAGTGRRATYANLPAGRYELKVRAADAEGLWSPAVLSLPVVVAPAPWNSAWAHALYVLLAVAALGALWRAQ
ncbi:MAG TPA: two-component regulator propeller domain-containing protein, partial [Steroidobacteraceae bacterium]|nr:two-component regulator propeller domain-containing protein [Steroidobacteraceae bacterium]